MFLYQDLSSAWVQRLLYFPHIQRLQLVFKGNLSRPLHRPFSQAEQLGFGILPLASDVVCDAKLEHKEQNNITVRLNQQAPAKTLEGV